jgi:arylsulfatase A-like enzyme
MTRRQILASGGTAGASAGVAGCGGRGGSGTAGQADSPSPAQQGTPTPDTNVILIQTDQWRGDALGVMGNDQVQTPNLDRMGEEGLVFENAYATNPSCSPAKAAIQTGMYPHSNRVIKNTYNGIDLPMAFETIAERMQPAGYDTGFIGKWHLDGNHEESEGYVPPERRRGYEFWRGFDRGHAHTKGHPFFDENGEKTWEEGYQPEIQTDLALEFIEDRASDPFMLCLSWGPPHQPREAPQEYHDMYDPADMELRPNVPEEDEEQVRQDQADYFAAITSLDDQIGRLLDTLEAQGIDEETMIVFTSDHGEFLGSQNRYGKDAPQEESIHVPLIVRHPGAVPGGQRSDAVVDLTDLMPTILSTCGLEIPEQVQGTDLTSHIRGDGGPAPTSTYLEGQLGYRYAWRAIRTQRYVMAVDIKRGLETRFIYDMEQDPYQLENLAEQDDPDAPVAELREQMVDAAFETDDRVFKMQGGFNFGDSTIVFEFDTGTVQR